MVPPDESSERECRQKSPILCVPEGIFWIWWLSQGEVGMSLGMKFLFFGATTFKLVIGRETEYDVPAVGKLATFITVHVENGFPVIRQESWKPEAGKEAGLYKCHSSFFEEDGELRAVLQQYFEKPGEKAECAVYSRRLMA